MEIWWIAPIYVLLFWICKVKHWHMDWFFTFLEGIFLAQYCFFYLPEIFQRQVAVATVFVLLGILLGSGVESYLPRFLERIVSPILFFCCVTILCGVSFGFVHGVLGGMGLYYAASAILPDITYRKEYFAIAFGGIVGFLLGTLLIFYQ
ncbi:hypothetical protein [Chakrabartyella piscis]|uniref:hypothetical protein n=1 Tax=Chakrabartyella piscis TaxID=2918914 RepID=UPI00295832D4|nr:hypothetical protein [Chakrabartyella piscis]